MRPSTPKKGTSTPNPIEVRINIRDILARIGILKPHHLWLRLGGSKSTAVSLFEGNIVGIQFDTMERLLTIIRNEDPRYYRSIARSLNASGMFIIDDPSLERAMKDEEGSPAKNPRASGRKGR